MANQYVAYIDEAGDDGFSKLATKESGGQSRWLVLGCCLATSEIDKTLPAGRDKILARFPRRQSRKLHFRDLKHDQKTVACQEIAGLSIEAALTLSHKITLPGSKWETTFAQKGYLYNYLLRWLLERVTSHCQTSSAGCSLRLVFSRRSGTDYQQMIEYLELMRDGREVMRATRSINWSVLKIEDITVETHDRWAGLQIADCIVSGFFLAVEPNAYGNYEQSYANLLREKLICSNGNPLNTGLTVVPSISAAKLDAKQKDFFLSFRPRLTWEDKKK
jgi:hypothetical protein